MAAPLRRVDHDFDMFKVHVGIEFANGAEKTFDGFTTFVPPRKAEALEIGHLEGAIFGEHLSAAFFGSRNDVAVNSSSSSFAFFMCDPFCHGDAVLQGGHGSRGSPRPLRDSGSSSESSSVRILFTRMSVRASRIRGSN